MSHKINVVLADDHALVLEGLRSLLAAEADMQVLATATDGERLLDAARRFQPDVIITDVQMPYMNGLDCLKEIRRSYPQTRVLILTAYADAEMMQALLAAGADGLLLKTDPPQQAVHAVRQVMSGQLVFPAAARRWLSAPASKPLSALSEREWEVLALVAEGLSNKQIAARLHISGNTVKYHLQNIFTQLGVSNRTEASRWYLQQRISPPTQSGSFPPI